MKKSPIYNPDETEKPLDSIDASKITANSLTAEHITSRSASVPTRLVVRADGSIGLAEVDD